MKFRDIIQRHLLTEGRTKSISKERFIDLLKNKCIDVKKDSQFKIFRGVNNRIDYGLIRPANHTRNSKGGTNFYQTFVSNIPSWSEHQDRTKSVIGTTHEGAARRYGDFCYLIPFKGAEFSVAPHPDMWTVIKKYTGVQNAGYEHMLSDVYKNVTGTIVDMSIATNYQDLKSVFSKVNLDDIEDFILLKNKEENEFVTAWEASNKDNLWDFLKHQFHPDNLEMKIQTYPQINKNDYSEVWTESPCLIAKQEAMWNLMNLNGELEI